ncbi:OmpA family protein [Spirosoma agri]|uniref:OmpA family protein n=1 Tax=Spirosoma agri TaxID=1987381 RepID=A0A6M0IE08_9BACT|nr:OmpA family protein [Spirosoma agri]NEU66444.1 OmpA family protein [Spirosoma agri]
MFANKTPWIVLLVLWMISSTWWHLCKIKQICADNTQPSSSEVTPVESSPVATPTETPPGADGYTIADGNLFRLDFPGNFRFAKSGSNADMNTLGGSLEPLVSYLKANPGRTLSIIGYYSSTETNSSTFTNLGLARAEGMKQYLIQQGIPATSLTIEGIERSIPITAKGDSLEGGLDFAFTGKRVVTPTDTQPAVLTLTAPKTETELAESEKYTSVFEPIDLYFSLGGSNYIKTDATRKFFSEATTYLRAHKDKKLRLTGHTDNSGPDATNMRLSRDRASDVKAKLRQSGISSDQILVEAKGETNPKADNSTLSGRKANRRVTVVVVQ